MGRKKGSRNYPLAFKRQVVAEALAAPSIAAVARKHGLNANMVHLWCKDDRFRPAPDPAVLLPVEVVDSVDEGHHTRSIVARVEITTRSGHLDLCPRRAAMVGTIKTTRWTGAAKVGSADLPPFAATAKKLTFGRKHRQQGREV